MNATDQYKRLSFGGGGAVDDLLHVFKLEGKLKEYTDANRLLSVADDISKIYIWAVFAIGLPGNILVVVTLLTTQKLVPATCYVVVLATLDAASLVGKLTAHQLLRNHVYIGNIGCKSHFLTICAGTLANWILILICAERFFTVCYPHKKPLVFRKKSCYVAVSLLSVVFLVFFAGVFCAMRGADSSGLRCGTYNEYLWFWVHVWFWINSGLYLFIPCVCVFPMIILVVLKLHAQSGNARASYASECGDAQEKAVIQEPYRKRYKPDRNERGLTIAMLVTMMLFLLLSLPACVYFLAYRRHEDVLAEAQWALFEQVQFVLVDSRHAINCLVYCLTPPTFRAHLMNILLCRKFRGKDLKTTRSTKCLAPSSLSGDGTDIILLY